MKELRNKITEELLTRSWNRFENSHETRCVRNYMKESNNEELAEACEAADLALQAFSV